MVRGVNLHSTVDGPSGGPSTIYNAMDGPGDQVFCYGWPRGTKYSAMDGLGGPSILLWMVRGDQVFCYGWSGGTKYSAMDGPGGPSIPLWMVQGDHFGERGKKTTCLFSDYSMGLSMHGV